MMHGNPNIKLKVHLYAAYILTVSSDYLSNSINRVFTVRWKRNWKPYFK